MAAPITDLPLHGVECIAANANRPQEFAKAPSGRLAAEVRLDHLGERLPRRLVRGQQSVRLEVDRDGLDGHALIMHLQCVQRQEERTPTLSCYLLIGCSRSRARFNSSTLTLGSPRKPSCRPSV